MVLPANSTQNEWPPVPHHNAYHDYETWDAWYTGSIDALEMLYATTRMTQATGMWGQVRRFFMGAPNPGEQAQRPIKLHVPIPAEIARMSSAILYSEMPKIEIGDKTPGEPQDDGKTSPQVKKQNARLDELLDDTAHATFLEAGELCAALSGAFIRVVWDRTAVPDKPFLNAVSPDAAVPDFRFGRLTGVTFWTTLAPLEGSQNVYRLLERHEPGTIEWGLYESMAPGTLGARIPLTEHPATAYLANVVNQNSSVQTGSDLLTAAYLPNIRPNRSRRKDPVASNLGRSDYDGAEGLFDALDECYTSWMRDIRHGKSRVLMDKKLLDSGQPGQGAFANLDREVFTPVEGSGVQSLNGGTTSPIEQLQFKIRFAEHEATATNLIIRIFSAAGYSPQTFGEASPNHVRSITATEVDSREKLTMLSRGTKIMYARPALQNIVAALCDVDEAVFDGPGRGGVVPDVEFPDAAAPSMDALATTLSLLRAAKLLSDEVGVEMLHPDWDDQQVLDEVDRLQAEAPPLLPDPMFMNGTEGAGNGGGADTGDGGSVEQPPGNGQ